MSSIITSVFLHHHVFFSLKRLLFQASIWHRYSWEFRRENKNSCEQYTFSSSCDLRPACDRNVITALLENGILTYESLDHDNIRTIGVVSLVKELNWIIKYADLSFCRIRQSLLHFSKQIHFQSYWVLGNWAFRNG